MRAADRLRDGVVFQTVGVELVGYRVSALFWCCCQCWVGIILASL